MKNYSVKRYQENDSENWNAFIGKAKNATFLFHRDFMDYHKDRFQDYSIVVLDEDKWVAVLPANNVENEVFSHQGLSYGGLVYADKLKLSSVIAIFKAIMAFLNENKMGKLQIKLTPSIYHQKPAEELNYALFLVKAQLIRRDTLAVIDMSKPFTFSKIRNRGIRNGMKNHLIVKEVADFEEFWMGILTPNLAQKHQATPVHSLQEITKLKKLFPKNIRQFNVYENGIIVAGTTIFETDNVAHCQYISGKDDVNDLGGIDFLFHHLITEVFKNKRFFDFGISNENQGRNLNNGLSYWKESFGASTIVHDFYEVETVNYSLLHTVIL
ncbi:GNAT family N-acetyltransferase [Flavobacterium cellulosilyticum]|uniref:GNAT family N-acetyltransferase n=1 Tax=Flavobacterium cellulosilyticum TaxID=2541731 RepID=A0A4R5CD34_9FLAO|nr:GNAT family N-acetyltransferase [Flavobacterium cellulosilyticum]TDD96200.1 GNAT family N-acetyltransferase [Flavobacterium cellulosilyticum]